MKQILVCLAMLFAITANTQPSKRYDARSTLLKIQAALNDINAVSYDFTRETRYYADNYHHSTKASMYIEYTAASITGIRFQATEDKQGFVYNGDIAMSLRKDMTIDTSVVQTARQLDNNSYLYHSIAMLKNILPLVTANDSIRKQAYDTVVNGKTLYCIEMEGPQIYLGSVSGIQRHTVSTLRRPYYLLVDKQTFMPHQFTTKYIRGSDDRDFATVIYTKINTKPEPPVAASWNYAAYLTTYQPYKQPEQKPVIAAGATISSFSLPVYTPDAIQNISSTQYAGKVVLLDFWFKSCGPCMEAMPHYKELQTKMGKDFQLLTINIEDSVDDIKFFYNKHKPNYPMMFNGEKLFESLGLIGCPSSVLLDKAGKVVKVFSGFNKEAIEKKVQELL